jgi:uncharacterized protein YdgA (DUF945 family)
VKKSIIIVTVLVLMVLGLWGGATYWFGLKTEERYRELLDQGSQGPYAKFLNESYSRGFLESKAQTIVEIQLPPGVAAESRSIRLILAHDIIHGPFPLSESPDGKRQFKPVMAIMKTGIVLSPETRSRLSEVYSQIPELASVQDYTVIDLDGSGEEHLLIPAFHRLVGSEDKVTVDWKGLSFLLNFTADVKGFSGSLSVPGLEVVARDFSLGIKEVKSTFNSHEGIGGLPLGEASFDLAALEFAGKKEGEPQAVVIRSFAVNTSSKASGDNINSRVTLRTDQVKVNETLYGPGVFEMEFRNLDGASLTRLQETVRDFQSQPPGQSAEATQFLMLARLGDILPDLLTKSPELEISQLDVKTTDGDFTGKARIAVDGTKLKSGLNLVTLVNAVTAQAEFKVGERLLRRVASDIMKERMIAESREQQRAAPGNKEVDAIASATIDEQLKTLEAQNILVKENGNYRAAASYKAGQIVLNDRPLSLGDLLQ